MSFTYNVEQFRESFEHEMTWLNGFMRNVARFGKKAALRQGANGKTWTYLELNTDANRLANALLDDGLKKNDVLMSMLFNSPEFILCYLAAHKTSSIYCPVNYRMGAGELALIFEDSRPEIFVYDEAFTPAVQKALEISGFKPRRMLATGAEKTSADFASFMRKGAESNPVLSEKQHIYDETIRLYTSGTTNRAKAVPINSINEVFSAHDVIMHYPINQEDRTLNLTPWFHRGGIHIGGPTPTLYVGGEVVAMREFRPRNTLELIRDAAVTWITGVPSIFMLLARAQKEQPVDLSHLRGLCSMGSPFSKNELVEYRSLFTPNILNGYGTTETFVNTYMRPFSPMEKCSSTGQACIDDDVRVVRAVRDGHGDPDDLVAKDNRETGEIIISSPAKSTGCYVGNPEMTARKFHKNFHYTGDVGVWDEDGFITVLSRKDDMIITSGENIYPAQVEAAINEHPGVAECAVIGIEDKLHGQRVAAYVVPVDNSLSVAELKAWCVAHPMLPAYKRPKSWHIVSSLPHTATGKIMHYKIRELARGERKK